MTNKQTYWLADPEGIRAPVEGADVRDYLTRVHGWTESTEPDRQDFVWLRNEDPDLGFTRLSWEAAQLDAWAGRGWVPSAPFAFASDGAVAETGTPVEPAPKSSPTQKSGAAGDKKVSD